MRTILRGMHCRAWYVMQDSKYDRILNAAASLIRRGGSDALTTTALARESRTSTRDIYHHFEDKYAVISALVERLHALYYSTINEAIKEATSPEDELAKIVDASFSDRLFNEDNMHIWVEYWRFVRFDSVKFNFANNAYDQSMARMNRILKDLGVNQQDAAFLFWTVIDGIWLQAATSKGKINRSRALDLAYLQVSLTIRRDIRSL